MTEISLDQLIERLEVYSKYLTEGHLSRLDRLIKQIRGTTGEADPESVVANLMREVQEQMEFVKGFRRRVAERGDSATTRELKDMIQASTALFTMLTRMNEDITNQDRLRKIEQATVEAIKTLPVKAQDEFFKTLEKALEQRS